MPRQRNPPGPSRHRDRDLGRGAGSGAQSARADERQSANRRAGARDTGADGQRRGDGVANRPHRRWQVGLEPRVRGAQRRDG